MKRRQFLKSVTLGITGSTASDLGRALALQTTTQSPLETAIKRVLIVFKCHLDIGFTDTQANVMHTYFKQYYPQAMDHCR